MSKKSKRSAKSRKKPVSLDNRYIADATAFLRREPRFAAAYKFLMTKRSKELAKHFYGLKLKHLSQHEIDRIAEVIKSEERMVVSKAFEDGVSPSESIFKMAIARAFEQ